MSFTIPTIFTAVDKLTAPIRKMSGSVQGFTKKAEIGVARLDRRLRKLTPSLGGLGKQIFAFASAAAVGTLLMSSVTTLKDYESNMASLQAITGVTSAEMLNFKASINDVAKETKSSAVKVAKAFELVGSAKPELLKDAAALGEVTKASIILSQASREDLEVSVQSLTGTLNQFGLGSEFASQTINELAAGAQAGAAAVPQITESLDKFGTVAAGMNISVAQSVGLIETLAEKNLKGAEAGNKLKNVLAIMSTAEALPPKALQQLSKFGVDASIVADKSLSLETRLKELGKIAKDETALVKVFGRENFVAGGIILKNVDKVKSYTDAVTGTNVAQEQANLNTSTLSSRLDQLSNAWDNMLTSNTATTGGLNIFKDLIVFVTDNLETIMGVVLGVAAVFGALKLAVLASQAAMLVYNVAMGVMGAISGTASVAIGANSVALGAYTAVQWLANAALWAFPVVWIIAAFIAIGAAIIALIVYWEDLVKWVTESDSVFAKLIRISLLPLILLFKGIGFVIGWLIEKFSQLVEWVKTSDSGFAKFVRMTLRDMANAFSMIGSGISYVIDAFATLWGWITKIASTALDPIMDLIDFFSDTAQSELGVNVGGTPGADGGDGANGVTGGGSPLINNKVAEQDGIVSKIEKKSTSEVNVNIKDPGGNADVESEGNAVGVSVSSTTGGF